MKYTAAFIALWVILGAGFVAISDEIPHQWLAHALLSPIYAFVALGVLAHIAVYAYRLKCCVTGEEWFDGEGAKMPNGFFGALVATGFFIVWSLPHALFFFVFSAVFAVTWFREDFDK